MLPARPRVARRIRLGRLFFVVLAGYLLVAAGFEVIRLAELRGELRRVREKVALQEAVNAGLREQIGYTQTDDYLEQAARQLGLVRPGEILFLLPESFTTPDSGR